MGTFATKLITDFENAGPGKVYGTSNIILTSGEFTDNLLMGRFAQMVQVSSVDTLSLYTTTTDAADNVLAGVVIQKEGAPVEHLQELRPTHTNAIEYIISGIVAVEALAADTPKFGDTIYVSLTAGCEGMATTTATGNVKTSAKFLEEITDEGLWLIHMTNAPVA